MNRSDVGDVEALVAFTKKNPNPLNQTLAPIVKKLIMNR